MPAFNPRSMQTDELSAWRGEEELYLRDNVIYPDIWLQNSLDGGLPLSTARFLFDQYQPTFETDSMQFKDIARASIQARVIQADQWTLVQLHGPGTEIVLRQRLARDSILEAPSQSVFLPMTLHAVVYAKYRAFETGFKVDPGTPEWLREQLAARAFWTHVMLKACDSNANPDPYTAIFRCAGFSGSWQESKIVRFGDHASGAKKWTQFCSLWDHNPDQSTLSDTTRAPPMRLNRLNPNHRSDAGDRLFSQRYGPEWKPRKSASPVIVRDRSGWGATVSPTGNMQPSFPRQQQEKTAVPKQRQNRVTRWDRDRPTQAEASPSTSGWGSPGSSYVYESNPRRPSTSRHTTQPQPEHEPSTPAIRVAQSELPATLLTESSPTATYAAAPWHRDTLLQPDPQESQASSSGAQASWTHATYTQAEQSSSPPEPPTRWPYTPSDFLRPCAPSPPVWKQRSEN